MKEKLTLKPWPNKAKDTPDRFCVVCGGRIWREGESPSKYKRRNHCSPECRQMAKERK